MGNQTINCFKQIIEESDKLNKKEKEILVKRIKGKTLEEIGKKYKVTAERIRQIEEYAVHKFLRRIYQLVLFKE